MRERERETERAVQNKFYVWKFFLFISSANACRKPRNINCHAPLYTAKEKSNCISFSNTRFHSASLRYDRRQSREELDSRIKRSSMITLSAFGKGITRLLNRHFTSRCKHPVGTVCVNRIEIGSCYFRRVLSKLIKSSYVSISKLSSRSYTHTSDQITCDNVIMPKTGD